MSKRFLLLIWALFTPLLACSTPSTPATLLYFVEKEQGGEPFRTRMIITAGFVRMDGGATNADDFLLFDRANSTIYSVSSGDQQILVIRPRVVELKPPVPFTHQVVPDNATYPSVGGHKVVHYELLTNNQRCYDLYAAEGLLPDAVLALRQFREALAGQQATTAAAAPQQMESACDLANNVFLPARQLAYGFPVRVVDMTGKSGELVDYKTDFRATADLLSLPEGYRRRTIEELRGK
ncbi:MAG TPA: hypothetical protein VEI74_02785 [Candidatus Methylomirabilis sp.]|nr:hypothetical protein [Candidatus Methylomirabilis sp.]